MIFNLGAATSPSTKKTTQSITDTEFGVVVCRRSAQARYVRIRVDEQGNVRASLPKRAPLHLVQQLLNESRSEIRELVAKQRAKQVVYENGMSVGHSHTLQIVLEPVATPKKQLREQTLTIVLPTEMTASSPEAQTFISQHIKKTLEREARAYLPRRLRYLADSLGFNYERERFGNQKGRWGSCSRSGTISLNVALMNLPHELIDYVLIHELVHTKHMNHSPSFWSLVETHMPDYQTHRKALKTMSPIC